MQDWVLLRQTINCLSKRQEKIKVWSECLGVESGCSPSTGNGLTVTVTICFPLLYKTLEDIKAKWRENWLELRERCKERSEKNLGIDYQ